MRLAVTGRTGQTVQALSEVASDGVTVLPVGRPDLDLTSTRTVFPALAAVAPDVIVNAAAYTAVDQAETDAQAAALVNGVGAWTVAEAAEKLGVPLIQLSTDYVFNGKKETPYTEADSPLPLSVYGGTKYLGETMVEKVFDNYVVLRTSWLYAPYGKNFVRTMVELAEKRKEVRVVADQRGTPTYAPDLAVAILRIAQSLSASPDRAFRGVFHFAGTGETSWAEMAKAIFFYLNALGRSVPDLVPISSAEYPGAAIRPGNSRLDCTKLFRTFGIVAPPWPGSLERCLDRLTTL